MFLLLTLLLSTSRAAAQCDLNGELAAAVDRYPCIAFETIAACENYDIPRGLEDDLQNVCLAPALAQAESHQVECYSNCPLNDGPCYEACNRRYDIETTAAFKRCEAAYYAAYNAYTCDAQRCYNSFSCDSSPVPPTTPSNPQVPEDPTPNPPPNVPSVPSPPPPTCPKRPDYHQLTCQVGSNFACLNPNANTKLVQKPMGKPNGCGAEGEAFKERFLRKFLAFAVPQFTAACDTHDRCFGTCSFGDDAQFEICNSNLFTSAVKICYDNYATLIGIASSAFEGCLLEAQGVYYGVQFGGCGPYNNAQQGACDCVPCDNVPMATNQITLDLLSTVQSVCAGVASSIAKAWPTFTRAINTAAQVANDVDRAALQFFAEQIGSSSPTTSSQVTELSNACGQGSRRKRNHITSGSSSNSERRAEASLSSFFTGLASVDPSAYACGPNDAQGVCQTAMALIEIARLSRQIDTYAGSALPSTGSSISSSIASSTSSSSSSSTTSASSSVSVSSIQSLPPTPSSSSSSSDLAVGPSSSVQSEVASSSVSEGSASTTATPSNPSPSATGLPSDPTDTQSHSSGPGQTTPSATQSPSYPDEAPSTHASADTATTSAPPASCTLVKTYGDSPDTPDSPDGQPEIPEIPDYPGGYYYLCQDGSIPPLSILPSPYGSDTVSAPAPTSTLSSSIEPSVSAGAKGPGGCVWTRIYGDSPDTPDSPDSPDGQPEIPETPEISQDGAYYWQCI